MKKISILIPFLIAAIFCSAQLTSEQKKIKKIFFDFLSFYQQNENKFNSFHLYRGTGKENGPPYKINWNGAEKYFNYLRKNVPYVGETYIKNEKSYFKSYDSSYKEFPEEELVIGFDFDRWAGGQESIVYTRKWYTSPKNIYEITIIKNKATLKIGSELMEGSTERNWSIVPFVKEKGKWVMADNIYPYDEMDENK